MRKNIKKVEIKLQKYNISAWITVVNESEYNHENMTTYTENLINMKLKSISSKI